MKKVLVINGHPDNKSFCRALAEQYSIGANSIDAECEIIHLSDIEFSPILSHGYRKRTELEPDLLKAWEAIKKAEHIVFVYPNWWGTYPALLKGFIDRLFLPGFAFEYQENSPFPKKLLAGKTARLIVTTDTPDWYYSLVFKKPGHNSMKRSVLGFCGIKPVKITTFGAIRGSKDSQRSIWLNKVKKMGEQLK